MKKIPTLFKREFQDHHVISISPEVSSPDLAWVLAGEGVATEKIDGACCAIIDGQFYKRYDAKKNKNYARADEIRSELSAKGVTLKDTKDGTLYTVE